MQSDFSQGKVWKNVINQAIPLMVAQLIQILYNVVDRIYIGHLPVIGQVVCRSFLWQEEQKKKRKRNLY